MNITNWIGHRTVYVAVTGSHAYGTSTPDSDFDYRGAAIAPLDYYVGLLNFEQTEDKAVVPLINTAHNLNLPDDSDITLWSLEKMVRLAADGNPNMIELLFSPEDTILLATKPMRKLFDIRDAFLSKLLKHRFSGYAMQQLKRMRNHRRWIENPPAQPTREQFGLEGIKLGKDHIHAAMKTVELLVDEWVVDKTYLPEDIKIQLSKEMIRMINVVLDQLEYEANVDKLKDVLERAANRHLGFDDDFILFLQNYRAYKAAKQDWQSYQNWKAHRNPARAKLELKHKYDTKHAMHLVRLLRMAREILEGRGVIVKRPDAKELLDVRDGAWDYDTLVSWAEVEDKTLDDVMKLSALPKSPDRNKINQVLGEVTLEYLLAHS
jgi:uncharacterized protein